jgi:beta-lactam-binding protein with PASTA domain
MRLARPTRDPVEVTQVIEEPTASLPPVEEPPLPGAPIEEPPPDRELWPWLLVLLVLVLAALLGAWLASRHGKNTSNDTTPGAPVQTVAPTPRPQVAGRVAVPRVIGSKAPAALTALRRAGLAGTTQGVFSAKPRNQVVAQKPAAAAKVKRGSTVALSVSKGQKTAPVPDVVGQQVAAAIATIQAQGLHAKVVRVPNDQPPGQVIAQHPQGGASAPSASAVRLNVSSGRSENSTTTAIAPATPIAPSSSNPPGAAAVTIPDLRGEKLNAARKELRKAGLVTEIRRVPNALEKNTVVAQSPRPDTSAKHGDHVLVTVSTGPGVGPKPSAATGASVPDVAGEDETTAIQDLRAAGFKVRVVDQDATDETEDGLVVGQDPAAGQQAAAKATVTIYVGRFSG